MLTFEILFVHGFVTKSNPADHKSGIKQIAKADYERVQGPRDNQNKQHVGEEHNRRLENDGKSHKRKGNTLKKFYRRYQEYLKSSHSKSPKLSFKEFLDQNAPAPTITRLFRPGIIDDRTRSFSNFKRIFEPTIIDSRTEKHQKKYYG